MNSKECVVLIIMIIMFMQSGFAQIVPPPMPPPPPPPGLPIDGYTIFLFIVGIIYGLKKIYK